jgi:hypothetical protein
LLTLYKRESDAALKQNEEVVTPFYSAMLFLCSERRFSIDLDPAAR